MEKHLTAKNLIALGVFAGICILAVLARPVAPEGGIAPPWYSVVPPLLAITLAIVTGKIIFSLGTGVFLAMLLPTNWKVAGDADAVAWGSNPLTHLTTTLVSVFSPTDIQIILFVVFILAMVAVMIVSGGMHGIVLFLSQFARGPRSTQFITALMGFAVFIDDYANTMVVGASMRPITDRHKVSREKLAFIVDATSAPIAGLVIISTWVGYEVGQFQMMADANGIDVNGFAILIQALPFRFYCIMMICFVAINAATGWDFGPMAVAERRAREQGQLMEPGAQPMTSRSFQAAAPDPKAQIRALSAVIPILALFVFLLTTLWWDGAGKLDGLAVGGEALTVTNWRHWMDVLGKADSIRLLAWTGLFGLVVATVCAHYIAKGSQESIDLAIMSGVRSAGMPIVILCLAWALNATSSGLGTAHFIVAAVGEDMNPIYFPAVTFVVASLTAFATGTSYGTMAILIPVAGPIAFTMDASLLTEGGQLPLITAITLAAVLDGAILGDHCSPVSDTTVMSSIASSCDHIHHVRTQLRYSLLVGALALFVGYLPAARGVDFRVSLGLAVVAIVVLLFGLSRFRPRAPAVRAEEESATP